MHFFTLGKKSKPALILLHGWGLSGEKYRKLAELLSGNFQVLVPDLPGFGKTPEPSKPYGIEDYAREVKKFMKEQDIDQAYFVGHSFGGRISMKMAHLYPKWVTSVVLTGAPGVEQFSWKRSTKRTISWFAAKALKYLTFIPAVKKLKQRYYSTRDIGQLDGVMKATFLKIIKEKLTADAKAMQQQTLLLWGARDQMAPLKDAEKMLKIIPHSYLKIYTKVGHRLPYEKPYEVAAEITQFFSK